MAVSKIVKKKNSVIQTDFCPNVIKAVISEAGNELIPPAAPRNLSNSIGYELQQLSGQHFPTKIKMVPKKGVVLKKKAGRSRKVCAPAKHSMVTQAGENLNHPVSETSYKCPQCAVSLGVAPCFSPYNQYKDYGNEYKEIKSNEGNTD